MAESKQPSDDIDLEKEHNAFLIEQDAEQIDKNIATARQKNWQQIESGEWVDENGQIRLDSSGREV